MIECVFMKTPEAQERVLAVHAHADDVAWVCAGTVAGLSKNRQVDNLLFTDSDYGGIGHIRRREEIIAMAILGMTQFYPVGYDWGFKDGSLSVNNYGSMTAALCRILDEADQTQNPYTHIITFGIDGYSGHPDHSLVANVVSYVFHTLREGKALCKLWTVGMRPEEREMWPRDYFVYIPPIKPDDYVPVDITGTLPQKVAAIRAHQSQLQNGAEQHIERVQTLPPQELFQMFNRV